MPVFPPEIWTIILGFLVGNHLSLYQFCLVSRWMHAIAEPLLYNILPCECILCHLLQDSIRKDRIDGYFFARVYVPSARDITRWRLIAPHIREISIMHLTCLCTDIIALLLHKSLTPLHQIRSLVVGPASVCLMQRPLASITHLHTLDLRYIQVKINPYLAQFLQALPNHQHHRLSNLLVTVGAALDRGCLIPRHSLTPSQCLSLVQHFPHISSLHILHMIEMDSFDPLWKSLSCLARLDSLTIDLLFGLRLPFTFVPPISAKKVYIRSLRFPTPNLDRFTMALLGCTSTVEELTVSAQQDNASTGFRFTSLFSSIAVDAVCSTLRYLKLEYQDPISEAFAPIVLFEDCGLSLGLITTLTCLVLNAQVASLSQLCSLIEPLYVLTEFDQSCWPLPQSTRIPFNSVFAILQARPTLTKLGLSACACYKDDTEVPIHTGVSDRDLTSLRYRIGWGEHCYDPQDCIEMLTALLDIYKVRTTVESGMPETDEVWQMVNESV